MNNYVFLGDSLTFGYGVKPKDNWVIINKGINGNTTADMLFRFDEDVIANTPKTLFIMGGTNDLLSNRSVSSIVSNIELMIKEAISKNITVILGIPPIIKSEEAQRLFIPSLTYDYCADNLQALKDQLINLSINYNIPYIDFYSITKENIDNNIFTDGIHLNPKGQNLLFEKAKEVFIPD